MLQVVIRYHEEKGRSRPRKKDLPFIQKKANSLANPKKNRREGEGGVEGRGKLGGTKRGGKEGGRVR